MKSWDCGNHRTGHPRWAQLIAKTLNSLAAVRRTQHATPSVSPSHGRRFGFVNVASLVSPMGNFSSAPSETQDLYDSSGATGESRYFSTGIAMAMPTSELTNTPIFTSSHRRDTSLCDSWSPVSRAVGRVSSNLLSRTWKPHIVLSTSVGIRLTWCFAAERRQVGNNVRDIFVCQRMLWLVLLPIGVADVWTPRNRDGS